MLFTNIFIIIAVLISFLFFALIPGFGAFWVRARWRRFRSRMLGASLLPSIEYSDLRKENKGASFRFMGTLDSIQDRNRIWIKGSSFSLAADLEDVPVYILPSLSMSAGFDGVLPDEQPQSVPWKQISSLPAGMPMFVAGRLRIENGLAVFHSVPSSPLLVVIYDGSEESLLKRAIWSGRQKNEYWNQFTLISIITGFFSLFFLAYLLLGNPSMRFAALVALSLSLAPLAPLLPPGVVFLFLYRALWKKARTLRAERDLQRLPIRYFESWGSLGAERLTTRLPDGELYTVISGSRSKVDLCLEKGKYSGIRPEPLSIRPADDNYYLFGAYPQEEGSVLKPVDPMVGLTMIHGDPEKNAERCSKRSMWYTVLSGLFLSLDILPNLFLILAVFLLLFP
ncbi:MAG TPA: hypothetical protein VMX75_06495 [Spirochaetia bacterium]|nr:hypothetical protein [Spirochaetia bacterium]